MKSLRADVGGDFVWFNRNGIEYVSANPATIALAGKTIASVVQASRAFSRYTVDEHGSRIVKTIDEGFVPPANADPFQPGSVFSPSPDLDERVSHQLADYTEKLVLADRQMNDLLDTALRNNDAHPVAATQKPVATYELNGRRIR
ncbi:MAG: hypothetical protein ACXVIJ_06170 [Thermoanaerobaculia bacterium]